MRANRSAVLVGADPAGVVFTSGGTEANALALDGSARGRAFWLRRSSTLRCWMRAPSIAIPVDWRGALDLAALDEMLAASTVPALVSVMLANNETGVIQPVARGRRISPTRVAPWSIATPFRRRTDEDFACRDLNVDFLTLSAHKLGGPVGIGALVLADPDFPLAPMLLGEARSAAGGPEPRIFAGDRRLRQRRRDREV